MLQSKYIRAAPRGCHNPIGTPAAKGPGPGRPGRGTEARPKAAPAGPWWGERCRDECTLDPNDWKAPLLNLGLEVPEWDLPPDGAHVVLGLPGCTIPSSRYVMEFVGGVIDFWDPEIVIVSRDSN